MFVGIAPQSVGIVVEELLRAELLDGVHDRPGAGKLRQPMQHGPDMLRPAGHDPGAAFAQDCPTRPA